MWSGVWNSLRRYGVLVKFCSELKSDEDLKAVVNDSNQVMDELSKNHSRGEVEGLLWNERHWRNRGLNQYTAVFIFINPGSNPLPLQRLQAITWERKLNKKNVLIVFMRHRNRLMGFLNLSFWESFNSKDVGILNWNKLVLHEWEMFLNFSLILWLLFHKAEHIKTSRRVFSFAVCLKDKFSLSENIEFAN